MKYKIKYVTIKMTMQNGDKIIARQALKIVKTRVSAALVGLYSGGITDHAGRNLHSFESKVELKHPLSVPLVISMYEKFRKGQ